MQASGKLDSRAIADVRRKRERSLAVREAELDVAGLAVRHDVVLAAVALLLHGFVAEEVATVRAAADDFSTAGNLEALLESGSCFLRHIGKNGEDRVSHGVCREKNAPLEPARVELSS